MATVHGHDSAAPTALYGRNLGDTNNLFQIAVLVETAICILVRNEMQIKDKDEFLQKLDITFLVVIPFKTTTKY
jgi:hypothetical protein